MRTCLVPLLLSGTSVAAAYEKIDRETIVRQFNVHRNASSTSTPLQVGNGDFAFGADVTGLQTFLPYNTLSSWAWHNSSLPTTPGQTTPADFTGLQWTTHGRPVPYSMPNAEEADISQWMIANPHRINLGRVGLAFGDRNVTEAEVGNVGQDLDMYTGHLRSCFTSDGVSVEVEVAADPNSSTIAINVESALLRNGSLGIFFDYPYATDELKFEDPFVGIWNATANHTTSLQSNGRQAIIQHDMDSTTYFTGIQWEGTASVTGPQEGTHRYTLRSRDCASLSLTVSYGLDEGIVLRKEAYESVSAASTDWWRQFWTEGAFINLRGAVDAVQANATELLRRIITSQYLLAVNEAGKDPPQESGLVNNGWYGKFHAEMFYWHLSHWGQWGRWEMLERAIPSIYTRFLPTSFQRAQEQGYEGARWGKMSDPAGRSAPGEINSLLIWQQPHPFLFAEEEFQAFPTIETLQKWNDILVPAADFMASYAFWNESTGVYDLGPPMYPVSENTSPNDTINPAFELAYWRFGLDIACSWQARLNKTAPAKWQHVAQNLAQLPIVNDTYVIYEGLDMWDTPEYTEDHPSMLMMLGFLPPPPMLNMTVMENTVKKVYETWNFTYGYGWDAPTFAMNAARMGDLEQAVSWLLDPTLQFDDAGYPVGGSRVATPYFPAASSMLTAVALLAGGWTGVDGPQFPDDWVVDAEGFRKAL